MSNDIISCYTRADAIADGVFIDVTDLAKQVGFIVPVAITSNLYHSHIKQEEEQATEYKTRVFLMLMYRAIQEGKNQVDNRLSAYICFKDNEDTEVQAVMEATSPEDPSPAMNIMLPEDN